MCHARCRRARHRAALSAAAIVLAAAVGACEPAAPPVPPAGGASPAQRIVTLSPHLAELVFAAGAGERLVGVVEFSDFPEPVHALPRVGDAFRVDYEALAALHPDLVLAWTSGTPRETSERLRDLGFRVESLEPTVLEDIAAHVERIGTLAGTTPAARRVAARFRARLAALRERGRDAAPVSVYVQLAERPWYTVTDRHFLGQGLRLCGGRNVFGELPGITAIVSLEAIVAAAPEVIVASDMGGGEDPRAGWANWPDVPAVRDGQLHLIDADLLSRPGPRILDGIERLCDDLDAARRQAGIARSGPASRLPEHLAAAAPARQHAGDHEQQVREAIEIAERGRVHRFSARQRPGAPLGAPADRARDVAGRGGRVATRQDEVLERRQALVEAVQQGFQSAHRGVVEHVAAGH
jgi:iron complex transport system substrate-binding protein